MVREGYERIVEEIETIQAMVPKSLHVLASQDSGIASNCLVETFRSSPLPIWNTHD